MNHFAAPSVMEVVESSPKTSTFWGTGLEVLFWCCLIALAAYLSFGIGFLAAITLAWLACNVFSNASRVDFLKWIRSFFAKLVIIGCAYQFMGFALISSQHIAATNKFFSDAGAEYRRVKLVDTMNYRKAVTEVELSADDFGKLSTFYREQAQAAIQAANDDEYCCPEGFTSFELASSTIDTELFDQIGHKHQQFKPLLIDYQQNEGWGNEKRGTHVSMDAKSILDDLEFIVNAFPKIDRGSYGPCRVIVWDSGYGSHRFFIWFPEHGRGFLTCRAAFG